MENRPDANKVFRFKNDLSQMKIEESESGRWQILVWMRHEKCWINNFEMYQENKMRKQLEKGEWKYLFEYADEEFSAKNMDAASDRFLDEAWGNYYVKYLEELGFKNMNIDAIEDLEDTEDREYYLLKQKLMNGSVLQTEVWQNDDGTYQGLAQEISLDRI